MGDSRQLDVAAVTEAVRDLCMIANYDLPVDVYDALKAAAETEESPAGREVLAQLVENADIAAADRVPICQDTGFAVIFAEVVDEEPAPWKPPAEDPEPPADAAAPAEPEAPAGAKKDE